MLVTLAVGAGATATQAAAQDSCNGASCGGRRPSAGVRQGESADPAPLLRSDEAHAVIEFASWRAPTPQRAAAAEPPPAAAQYDTAGLVSSEDLAASPQPASVGSRRYRGPRIPAATAFAASLIATDDTCMGSRSFGVQAMGFGVSFATTWQDRSCRRLKNARALDALGYRPAAIQLLCQDTEVWRAMERAGTPCPLQTVNHETTPADAPEPEPPQPAPIASYDVLFDFDSARLRPEGEAILQPLLAMLQADPAMSVDIEGHTDWVGTDAYNRRLSQRRAQAVVDWLVAHGIERGRMRAVGRGEAEPVADNRSAAGRQQNRRVEVRRRPPPALAAGSGTP